MFLCAIACQRDDTNSGVCLFDSKIGVWPIVEYWAAQRAGIHREWGTMITTPVSCTKDKYCQMLIEKVIPAIKAKWPDHQNRNIVWQQDSAYAPVCSADIIFGVHAMSGNWNILIETQPARSPDCNILYLSFFRVLQSLQWMSRYVGSVDGLIAQVLDAYRMFEPRKIDFEFPTLQTVLDCILCYHRGNTF